MVATRLRHALLALVLAGAAIVAAPAPAPAASEVASGSAPVLRVETGMHGAAINRVFAVPADKQVVTVSDDKTLRLWSLENGQLQATLRPPIGDGPDGALYAVALSPSGKALAVSGQTAQPGDPRPLIYVFDRVGQKWMGGIRGVEQPAAGINALAFLPARAGQIAVGASIPGLRVVDTGTGAITIADKDYKEGIQALDATADGLLAATSLDGGVRLYDKDLRRVALWRPQKGKPFGIAFDPTGQQLAVGFLDRAEVQVLSAKDLKPVGLLTGEKDRIGALSKVTWAEDGKAVWAAGTYGDKAGRKLVRRWESATVGADVAVGDDTVLDVHGIGSGALFATAAPSWGGIDAKGRIALNRERQQADFRDGYNGAFAVSPDGGTVDFPFASGGKSPARFDLIAGDLTLAPQPRFGMLRPDAKAPGLTVTDWRNGAKPKANGTPVTLDANELSRSVAVLPDGSGFLMGTDYFLRYYTSNGPPTWKVALPAAAWVVGVAPQGGYAVAGLADGTLRWFRLADGAPAFSLFAHPDGRRWVLWTPEGFFDHGKGGESLIGYHVNLVEQGRSKGASFVAVEQLYREYYRRDLVVKRFRGDAEPDIKAQAKKVGEPQQVLAAGLPPLMRLAEYCLRKDESEKCVPLDAANGRGIAKGSDPIDVQEAVLRVRFEVEDRGGGVGDLILRRNGATVPAAGQTRAVKGAVRIEEREIPLERGDNVIQLSAYDKAGKIEADAGERPTLTVRYQAGRKTLPVLRIVAIGLNHYKSPDVPALTNAAADATGLTEALQQAIRGSLFSGVDALLLTDEKATKKGIIDGLEDVARRAGPEDTTVLFFAGHGVALDGQYYFLPYDLSGVEAAQIKKDALTQDQLTRVLAKLPSWRTAVVLDTCYSGAFAVEDAVLGDSRDQTIAKQIGRASGRFILAGSTSQQEALDGSDGHGVFTGVLLKGLAGAADQDARGNRDGKVDVFELGEYAKRHVPEVAAVVGQGYRQIPRWFFTGDDMFVVKEASAAPKP